MNNPNKQQVLTALAETLKLTRKCRDLQDITYVKAEDKEEFAVVRFEDETFSVRITADSGFSIIKDVIRFLDRI